MRRPSRRTVLGGLGVLGAGLVGARVALPYLLRPGTFRRITELSSAARDLVAAAFEGIDRSAIWDVHVHLLGLGAHGTWVNPNMRSHAHPVEKLRFEIYLAAAGVRDEARAADEFLERLLRLHRAANPDGKLILLAFDRHVDESGIERPEATPFHTPDAYALRVAASNDDVVAVASVHPYRADALERLDAAAEAGAVGVKWLPNAMGIDPASKRCDAFYDRMVEHGLTLVSHTGREKAVHVEELQKLGNPLRLRRALDRGVRVVAAHCASLGRDVDLDPGPGCGAELESFDLFLRMMSEPQYEGRLFGEISALTQINRCGRPLIELLRARELHPRLVNGSDYPLPAIDPLVSTLYLVRRQLLDPDERAPLNEIFDANPLLFDFVLKRRLRVIEDGGVKRFAESVFESRRVFSEDARRRACSEAPGSESSTR